MEATKKSEFQLVVDKMNFMDFEIRNKIINSFKILFKNYTNEEKKKQQDLKIKNKNNNSDICSTDGSSEKYMQTQKIINSKSVEKYKYTKSFQEILEYNFEIKENNSFEKETYSNISYKDNNKKNLLIGNINNPRIKIKNEIINIKSTIDKLTKKQSENSLIDFIDINESSFLEMDSNPNINKNNKENSNEEKSNNENSDNKINNTNNEENEIIV